MRAVADSSKCDSCKHKNSKTDYPCNCCDDNPKNKKESEELDESLAKAFNSLAEELE